MSHKMFLARIKVEKFIYEEVAHGKEPSADPNGLLFTYWGHRQVNRDFVLLSPQARLVGSR
jgi:hypothetical protein